MQSVYFCLKSNVLLSRPERDEEAVKKRKQEKKKISAEAKVHSGWEKLSRRPRFTIWQNLFWVTVAHTSHTRSKENQPINVVAYGNYQVKQKQYKFFVQARKKEMRRKMRQKLKGREGRWTINSSKYKYRFFSSKNSSLFNSTIHSYRFFSLKIPSCLTSQYTDTVISLKIPSLIQKDRSFSSWFFTKNFHPTQAREDEEKEAEPPRSHGRKPKWGGVVLEQILRPCQEFWSLFVFTINYSSPVDC